MKTIDWINSVLHKPWKNRASGPHCYDCWGLIIDSFKRIDGVELEDTCGYSSGNSVSNAADIEILSNKWSECEASHGAVFCCYKGDNVTHVGRVFHVDDIGLAAIHSRGEGGQVQCNRISAICRKFETIKFFRLA